MAFLCLLRKPDASVKVQILHHMMHYFELPSDGGRMIDLNMMALPVRR